MSSISIEQFTVKGDNKYNASHTVNFFVIHSKKESVLIDSGFPSEESINKLNKIIKDFDIKKAIITHHHEDHAGGIQTLIENEIKIFSFNDKNIHHKHPLNNEKYNYKLTKNITLFFDGFKLEILHTPGHAQGHISLLLREDKILFSGDNVVGEGTTWIGPPDGDMLTYLNTLKYLQTLPIKKIFPGHGNNINNPQKKLESLINHRYEREEKIIEAMKKGNFSLIDITKNAYLEDNLPEYIIPFAQLTVLAHIEKLIKEEKAFPIDPQNGIYKINERQ